MRARLVLAYAAVTLIMAAPMVNYSALASAIYPGDARLNAWILAWDNHAILSRLPLFDSNIFYPTPHSLAYNEHLFGLSLVTLPIYVTTGNPVLAYNIVWLFSFLLNGVAMHGLVKRYVRRDVPAFAGSLIFTFSFYKMLQAHGHLQQIWTWLLPLSVLCLERWQNRPQFRRALTWSIVVLLQALTSWYLAVMIVVAQAFVLLGLVPAIWRQKQVARLWHLGLVAAFAAAVVFWFAKPYRVLPSATAAEAASNSADIAAYIVPPENTWVGQLWLARVGQGPRWIWGERTLFVGWLALALASAGVAEVLRTRRWRVAVVYSGLIVLGYVLSLGPSPTPGDTSWNAFSFLGALPGLGPFRAPARFALLVLLGVSVFAAFGAQYVDERFSSGRLLLVCLIPLMLSEWYVVRFPSGKPAPFEVPPIYRVDPLNTATALVSLPQYREGPAAVLGSDYLYFSTAHWKQIVNGFGRAEPPEYPGIVRDIDQFPAAGSARTLRRIGVEYVVLHTARYPDLATDVVRDAKQSADYELVGRVGADYLFRVRAAPEGSQ